MLAIFSVWLALSAFWRMVADSSSTLADTCSRLDACSLDPWASPSDELEIWPMPMVTLSTEPSMVVNTRITDREMMSTSQQPDEHQEHGGDARGENQLSVIDWLTSAVGTDSDSAQFRSCTLMGTMANTFSFPSTGETVFSRLTSPLSKVALK